MVIQILTRWLSRHFYVILTLLVVSCLQALILTFDEFIWEAISANQKLFSEIKAPVPNTFILDYLNQIGIFRVGSATAIKAIVLFAIQSIPVCIYSYCHSIKSKRIASLIVWLLPPLIVKIPLIVETILSYPSHIFLGVLFSLRSELVYLLSPVCTLDFFLNLASDTFDKKIFYKGIFFFCRNWVL
jgi:hypothetical protein